MYKAINTILETKKALKIQIIVALLLVFVILFFVRLFFA